MRRTASTHPGFYEFTRRHRLVSALCVLALAPWLVEARPPASPIGMIVNSSQAFLGKTAASSGASIFSGDSVATEANGSVLLRLGTLSLQLEPSSAVHIYSAPYGAVIELNFGSVVYRTEGGKENLALVASDIRVTPDPRLPDTGRVSIDNPCRIIVYSQHGQVNVRVGKVSRRIEEGTAFRVMAENSISYHEFRSPDDSDYHLSHDHESCTRARNANDRPPQGAGRDYFIPLALIPVAPIVVGSVLEALESPDRP